jgi:hypothetical protein
MVSAYQALARSVPPEKSRTAALIRSSDASLPLRRLRGEIGELVAVLGGTHSHLADKSGPARGLLAARGLEAGLADLLLEASQVSYWWLVSELAAGRAPDPVELEAALRAGAGPRGRATPVAEQARSAASQPTASSVFGLLGRTMAEAGLPIDLFAELDLAEMAARPYLTEALGGA